MAHGYTLKILHIDLTVQQFYEIPIKPDLVKTYLGGRALGAKLYYDLIRPETDPLAPDNLFMVLTGPLTATMAPGAGKHLIITKSPATGGWLESYSSGYFAVELKFAGYDALIVSGRSASPVCLLIRDRQVEFEDAGPLWGKDSFAAESQSVRHARGILRLKGMGRRRHSQARDHSRTPYRRRSQSRFERWIKQAGDHDDLRRY